MKLLHFSDSSGEQEYVVLVEDVDAVNPEGFERSGCTLDGTFEITPSGKSSLNTLPCYSELVRS